MPESTTPRIFWSEPDRQRGHLYTKEAQEVLDNPQATRRELQVAHDTLADWHRTFHGGGQQLPCTGCQVAPVIATLATRLQQEERPQ